MKKYVLLPCIAPDTNAKEYTNAQLNSYISNIVENAPGKQVDFLNLVNDQTVRNLMSQYEDAKKRMMFTGAILINNPFDGDAMDAKIITTYGTIDPRVQEALDNHYFRRDLTPDMEFLEFENDEEAIEYFNNFVLEKVIKDL